MKKILACLALAFAGSANAALITSTSNAALAGATIQTFDAVAPGYYASLSLPGVTIKGIGGSMHVDGSNAAYGMGGLSLNNYGASPSSFELLFTSPVTGFGIFAGAVDSVWQYRAYNSTGQLLESFNTGLSRTPQFYGIANATGIARVTFSNTGGDWAIFDNLYIGAAASANVVPEPASVALFGVALAGLIGVRRGNKGSKTS
jgi:hypothetical protein